MVCVLLLQAVSIGFLVSLGILLWIGIGSFILPPWDDPYMLPTETYGCPNSNINITTPYVTPSTAAAIYSDAMNTNTVTSAGAEEW